LIVKRSYSNLKHNWLNCQYLRIISIYLIEKCKEGIKIIIREDQSKKHIRIGLSSTYPRYSHHCRSAYRLPPSGHLHIIPRTVSDHQRRAFPKDTLLFPISSSFRIHQHSYLHWRTYTFPYPTSYFIETIRHISKN
jgi:hypothetical protein